MPYVLRPLDINSAEFEEKLLAAPSAQPLSGDILIRSRVEFTNDARTIISGVWESDPGESRWEFLTRGEIIYVVSGRMTVRRDGEDALELTAGSAAFFPIGWVGTWSVTETVRKFYVVYK
ncbi:cupin domain-containing protein [Microbacterium rhizomatis]|uniref:DUF861 domain-containing protein n=1 Tax=Microbacterium rhizomatis TaxID=1631477 RepID=A0A5J5J040_9MICO|nr:cupin domain-containing protein [Microbacterium rhizomatis]KAA9106038.1 DUF861 domain-containing protein [Microbacterium rhizomatis]